MTIKKRIGFLLVLLMISAITETSLSQIIVSPAADKVPGESPGFLYALPKTTFKVDVIIQKTQRIKGPYSEFAEKILGISDFIKQDETQLEIIDMIVESETIPDSDAWFFVEFDERGSKDARSLVFDLQSNGIILGADDTPQSKTTVNNKFEKTIVNGPDEKSFSYYAERNLYQRVDTIIRKITIDTMVIHRNILQSAWVDRNPEQKAKAAAEMIHRIRESRYNLISGFQEIDFGKSIVYMDQQLRELEEEYLSLFLGKEKRSLTSQSFYYTPEANTSGKTTVATFSETAGLLEPNAKASPVTMEFSALSGPGFGKQSQAGSRLTNALYYRIPAVVTVNLSFNDRSFLRKKYQISQMGAIAVAPITKTRVLFDPESGMVTTVKRE